MPLKPYVLNSRQHAWLALEKEFRSLLKAMLVSTVLGQRLVKCSPVAFHSRTFTATEKRYSVIEKEAAAIMNAVRKRNRFFHGYRFTLVTDQRAVGLMLDSKRLRKIKNTKLQLWRAESGNFDYHIEHRPGKLNVVDALSRILSTASFYLYLAIIHQQLRHPDISRPSHFVRFKNLPFSTEDVKKSVKHVKSVPNLNQSFSKSPSFNKNFASLGSSQY